MRRISFLMALAFTPALLPAQALDTVAVAKTFARFDNSSGPGCALAISRSGALLYQHAWGMADLEHDIPNSVNTIFEAGSVSKQFTAAAVMLLAARGKLSLDDDIHKWFPELQDFGAVITVRNLLHHTSGLRDWGALAWIEGWPRGTRVTTEHDVLTMMSLQRTLNHGVGAEFSYTNTGYNLAVLLVERASHESFPAFTKRELFDPIGMTHTQWRDDFRRVVKGRAQAYSFPDARLDMPFENAYGNGGLLTTVGDLLKWNDALTARRVGSPDVSKVMETPGTLVDGKTMQYGGGLFIRTVLGVPEIGHDGSTAGYRAYLARYPGQQVSVAMLCNAALAGSLPVELARDAVQSVVPFRDIAAAPAARQRPEDRYALHDLKDFTGVWQSKEMAVPLTIVLRSDTLRLVRRPGLEEPLIEAAPNGSAERFLAGQATLSFERDVSRQVVRLFVSVSRALNVPYSR